MAVAWPSAPRLTQTILNLMCKCATCGQYSEYPILLYVGVHTLKYMKALHFRETLIEGTVLQHSQPLWICLVPEYSWLRESVVVVGARVPAQIHKRCGE